MTLEASGTIKFKRDAGNKTPWTIASKQLGIEMDGSGDIDDMIERLTDRVREKFTEEFRTMPRSVSLAAYSMTFKFDVVGPVNHVLEDFGQGKYKATVRLADGTEIPLDKLTKTADQVIAVAKRTGKTVDQVLAEAKGAIARQKKTAEKGSATS